MSLANQNIRRAGATLPEPLRRVRLPVIGAPMFIITNPKLVIAQCKAGIIGAFPALNARPEETLDAWLTTIDAELARHDAENPGAPSAPYAVNQIVHRSNHRLDRDLAVCEKHRVPIVITSLGANEDVNRAVHAWGGIVLHDVTSNAFARKAVEKGADGLVLVAAGAGGHASTKSPFALIQEVREWFSGPIALSGAISTGDAILAAQAMGADLAYAGSMFIATEEANADAAYKAMVVDSSSDDIVYSSYFTGVPGNYLRASVVRLGLDPDKLPEGDRSAMDFAGAKAWRDIWGCGQGIGCVRSVVPAAERVAALRDEYVDAAERVATLRGPFR